VVLPYGVRYLAAQLVPFRQLYALLHVGEDDEGAHMGVRSLWVSSKSVLFSIK